MKKVLFLAFTSLLFFSACGESQTKKAQVVEQKKEVIAEQKSITLTTLEGTSIELSFSNNILVSKDLNGKISLKRLANLNINQTISNAHNKNASLFDNRFISFKNITIGKITPIQKKSNSIWETKFNVNIYNYKFSPFIRLPTI